MNLSDCLFLHWTLVGSLVLLVEAVHFSSARKAGGPSQPLLNQFETWCYGAPIRTNSSKTGRKLPTMSLQCVFIALRLKQCTSRSDIGCIWFHWFALEHEFI